MDKLSVNKQRQPTGFSGFAWALGLFCLPSILWPLALLISPFVSDNPNLDTITISWFSTILWIYPVVLLTIAVVLNKLRRRSIQAAWLLLILAFIGFYGFTAYLISRVWL